MKSENEGGRAEKHFFLHYLKIGQNQSFWPNTATSLISSLVLLVYAIPTRIQLKKSEIIRTQGLTLSLVSYSYIVRTSMFCIISYSVLNVYI